MKIIDTHAHVLSASYKEKLKDIIKEIKDNNMNVINISFNIESSKETLDLYKNYNFLYPVIGIHPSDTIDYSDKSIIELEKIINDNVVAIGEIGLDYHYDNFDIKKQQKAFVDQIELAKKYNLPIVIHTRDSLEDTYKTIKKYSDQKFLLHSWSGDKKMTKKFLNISNNIYFSYNGILTFKNGKLQQEVIKYIPIEKLMFETDCPYLSPEPLRGQQNKPCRVEQVIRFAATLLELSFEELNNINNENTYKFFKFKK